MPRLWAETMDAHRRQVHDAILDATAELIAEHGPMSVGMSAIADRTGIGRATLYKYFSDVESILLAWHARDFGIQLDRLRALSEADDVTLGQVVDFVRGQRRRHPQAGDHHAQRDVLGALAHTIAGGSDTPAAAIERDVVSDLTRLVERLVERKEVRRDEEPVVLARWILHTAHAPPDLDDRAVARLIVDSLAPRSRSRS